MRRTLALVLVLLAWPAVSFGQTPVPGCPEIAFDACGGDLTGTWAYAGIDCVDIPDMTAQFGPQCTGVTTSIMADVTGTMTFNADGTWVSHEVSNMSMAMMVPQVCLPEGATCDMLSNPELASAPAEGGCQLTHSEQKTEDETGTYVLDGSTATLTDASDPTDVDVARFCVQGDTAVVELVDESGARAMITNTRVP